MNLAIEKLIIKIHDHDLVTYSNEVAGRNFKGMKFWEVYS